MTSSLNLRRAGLCFTLFLIVGCGDSSPTAPTTDFITLTSIVPAAGTSLTAGDRVTFTAVVTCTLVSSNGGFAGMVLQDQANRSLAPGEMQPQVMLVKGTTTVTLSQTVTIPGSGSTITAAFPIFIDESTTTRAVVRREYTVR
jgi:hypothetical protein